MRASKIMLSNATKIAAPVIYPIKLQKPLKTPKNTLKINY